MTRARDLQDDAARRRLVRLPRRRRSRLRAPSIGVDTAVTIRYAFPDDERPLRRLAALDSALMPAAPVLVAEIDGELRAALSITSGETIADPFHPSAGLLELLQARAQQLSGEGRRGARRSAAIAPLPLPGLRR